jgi:nitrogenase molybdenum-iron protein alpha/beta subunit/MoaA/NifB/PqqE/SkfB family radical SAM enzyme
MATHYNEPVDIASSSLTEEGTVFGGEKNLIKGLENLIRLYHPEVIGVATTCLAETIGEDVPRLVRNFRDRHPDLAAKIITVPSAGYAGTQYEGFFRTLRSLVEQVEMRPERHGGINVVTSLLSPADTRWLKELLAEMRLDCILLPDLSENLDGGLSREYRRLPAGGTPLERVAGMAGSRLTIELGIFIPSAWSPGEWLRDNCGVPLIRLNPPIGLRDTDALIAALVSAGGETAPRLEKERGRRLDAMVDSHKYNARIRAALFGEPDFVLSLARLCAENGALPVVAATGSRTEGFAEKIRAEIAGVMDFHLASEAAVLDDCDFEAIEMEAGRLGANLLIGGSDGRRMEEHTGIPLIRAAFPVHDQVGGQRIRTLGHSGGLELMDRMTNAVLGRLERGFRGELRDRYCLEEKPVPARFPPPDSRAAVAAANRRKSETHPCFNGRGGEYARLHLPVAPACNIQCNYCTREFDCPNESRPGVSAGILTPEEALARYREAAGRVEKLAVVGIAGPGDALANWDETRETLRLIRAEDANATFCLSTNGLLLPLYADEMSALGVSHATVTVNALDSAIGAKIYRQVDYLGSRYRGEAGAAVLMANQLAGIRRLTELGVVCKVNIVMLKGVNDLHIPEVAAKAGELGADLVNIMQMIPVKGSAFEGAPLVSNQEIGAMRESCGAQVRQMLHCRQCRADAVGRLDEDVSLNFRNSASVAAPASASAEAAGAGKPLLFAVASKGGMLVDQHFGHASDFYIYECRGDGVRFRERRGIGAGGNYCGGADADKAGRMERIVETIGDCQCVLAMRIGESPKRLLRERGIAVRETYDRIEDAVLEAASVGGIPPGKA